MSDDQNPNEHQDASRDERHKARMERKKAVVDQAIARADRDQGVLLVLTGNGKGKSSSAFGMLARTRTRDAGGCGAVHQGSFSTGEEAFFRRFPEVRYHVMERALPGKPRIVSVMFRPQPPPGTRHVNCWRTLKYHWWCWMN